MAERDEILRMQESIANRRSEKKRQKKVIIALFLSLAAAVVGRWYYLNRPLMDETTKYWFDKFAVDGSMEGKNSVEIQGFLNSIVEEGMYNVLKLRT